MEAASTIRGGPWRHIPNALSMARLVGAGMLLGLLAAKQAEWFRWVLLGCMLSDAVDGWISRRFDVVSELGARLDSAADVATMLGGALGIAAFQRAFLTVHWLGLALVLGLYAAEMTGALWRYGRISSFHTWLDRAAACSAGAFAMVLFVFGFQGWLYSLTVALYMFALTEELLLICLLREWQSDVGGLYRVSTSGQRKPDEDGATIAALGAS